MLKRLFNPLMTILAIALVAVLSTSAVGAVIDIYGGDVCKGANADTGICETKNVSGNQGVTKLVKTIVDVLLYIVGIVSVIVIIVSGISYATSGGDPSKVKRAKDTLLYAVIGLVVAIFAYAIVGWIYTRVR